MAYTLTELHILNILISNKKPLSALEFVDQCYLKSQGLLKFHAKSIYIELHRIRNKGLIKSSLSKNQKVRGERQKVIYEITEKGKLIYQNYLKIISQIPCI